MRSARVAAVLAATVAMILPLHASATPLLALQAVNDGSIGLRLVDVPVSAGDDPRAQLYIIDHLPPGSVIQRRIELANSTGSAAHILLYPAAATIEHGTFLGAAGHTPNDLATWMSIRPGMVDVEAGGGHVATVTIRVPRNAAPGERYGVVWAEVRSAPEDGDHIIQVNRVGIRIYLSVGPGGAPEADFDIESLTAARAPDGSPSVLASVHNTGGRALDMNGVLQLLDGPGGLSAGPFPAVLGTTLGVGETEPVTIALDEQVPAGPWDARITLRSGLLERKARATITFPDEGASLPVATTSIPSGWWYSAIVIVLIVIVVGFLAIRRRRSPRRGSLIHPQAGSSVRKQPRPYG